MRLPNAENSFRKASPASIFIHLTSHARRAKFWSTCAVCGIPIPPFCGIYKEAHMATITTRILDGRLLSAEIRAEIKKEVEEFKQKTGTAPGLATILVGDNPASHTYVANKIKAC